MISPALPFAASPSVDILVRFVGLLPNEEVIALVNRLATRWQLAQLYLHLERASDSRYIATAYHGAVSTTFIHAQPDLATHGAVERLGRSIRSRPRARVSRERANCSTPA